jgi:methylenetetrahydrofolate dehydrogenase (NADP+)/methenyltetrahydrofolate cyclohydrolase
MGYSNVYGIPGLATIRPAAQLLDGRVAASELKAQVAVEIEQRAAAGERVPALATILVGDDPASHTYVSAKRRACTEVGIRSVHHSLPADSTLEKVASLITSLNADEEVTGILLQLPLPAHLDTRLLLDLIDPAKDVDGLTTTSGGRLAQGTPGFVPCTPKGVLALLEHYDVDFAGRRAVVVGRSELVGRPLATLLSQRDATVTLCHSRTRDLAAECRNAELLIVAAGRERLVSERHVAPGAIVVDVGIHRTAAGLVGDVDHAAIRHRVAALTPVPGGVGPMTIASLLENALAAVRTNPLAPPL